MTATENAMEPFLSQAPHRHASCVTLFCIRHAWLTELLWRQHQGVPVLHRDQWIGGIFSLIIDTAFDF